MKKILIKQKLILLCVSVAISISCAVARDANVGSIQQEAKPLNSITGLEKRVLSERCGKPISEEMETITVCKYSSASIELVYQNMLKKHVGSGAAMALKSTLPTKNTQYDVKDNPDGVIYILYKYTSKNDLLIEVQFAGGLDSYAIKQQKNEVQLTITNSPD